MQPPGLCKLLLCDPPDPYLP